MPRAFRLPTDNVGIAMTLPGPGSLSGLVLIAVATGILEHASLAFPHD